MTNDKLLVSNISKSFGDKVVLDDFSAEFHVGFNLLSGSSGVGKTTLLRIISGLESADGGEIVGMCGNTAIMFQEDRLFPWLNAVENISCIAQGKDELRDKAEKLLSNLMILPCDQYKYPSELSGGMKRRVSLARTLIYSLLYGGNVVLLDEPFKGLDSETMDNAIKVCREYLSGKIVIIVSHEITAKELYGANSVYM